MTGKLSSVAPAKLNLALHVVGQRTDGLHLLESLVAFTQKGDAISIATSNEDHFEINGPFAASLRQENDNLILRARDAFRSVSPSAKREKISIELTKNLPIASGIGGGSADAASVLRLMGEKYGDVPQQALVDLALDLGADVPMCLSSRTAIAKGVGEELEVLRQFPRVPIVLVNPGISLSTPEVFAQLEQKENTSLPPAGEGFADVKEMGTFLSNSRNDLQMPAISLLPQIADLIELMGRQEGCFCARMTGSGATVFGLFNHDEQASKAAKIVKSAFPDYWTQLDHLEAASAH